MKALLLAAALASPIAVAACSRGSQQPIVVHAGSGDHANALTSVGSATLAVTPDCADLTLTVDAESPRAGDALTAARKKQDAVIAALKKLGVADKDLALSTLGVDPVYRSESSRSVLDGFRAHVTITATTRAFDQVGPLMQAAADAGVSEMSSRFRRSDLEAIRKQVRAQALEAAQAKAKDTAQTLGLSLVRITAVSDASQSYLYSNEYFPSAGGGGGLVGEQQPLTIEVTLTYEI
ncbi:MAG TPA: SIMPL domain-containing protein [Kofleriaceae bacterium]|jgi:uncharacterized protein YggE|nr:SIMPL domain-containing protein [Kofleriaceae bacterium]